MNAQVEGTTHAEKFYNFKKLAQRWRLAYMGVTVIQDGPDLANQGTIVVSQPPVQPRVRYTCFGATAATMSMQPKSIQFTEEDRPNFNRSQAMPNAYFNKSKEGAYVPLKLTETCQDWVSEADEVTHCSFDPAILPAAFNASLTIPSSVVPIFPYYDLQSVTTSVGPPIHLDGQATSCMLSGNWAHISARNLAPTTSYTFFVRCGVEMQVSPSSTLSPQLKLSPQYDPVALTTYFAICRELKDAYPADYNTTGKLWGVLKEAYSKLSPALTLVPGGQYLKPMLDAGIGAGDLILKRKKKNRRRQRKAQGNPKKKDLERSATRREKRRQRQNLAAQDASRALGVQ